MKGWHLLVMFFAAILGQLAMLPIGAMCGRADVQSQAVKRGFAEWRRDDATGETTFTWKEKP